MVVPASLCLIALLIKFTTLLLVISIDKVTLLNPNLYKVYKVNTKDGFNSNYVSEETNKDATSIEELKVKALTLIKVENGSIVEYGTYKELMNNNATFKSLVELN